MKAPLDELYFVWLYSQVNSVDFKNPSRTYWFLLRKLFTTEFIWFVPNDDNRVEDGRALRHEFIETEEIEDVDAEWLSIGCSVLEMLIGLARRLSFEDDGEPRVWFWHLIDNLDLYSVNDRFAFKDEAKAESLIEDAVDRMIWRTYAPDGYGGLFPLKHPTADQRHVELWYQLSAYLMEREL